MEWRSLELYIPGDSKWPFLGWWKRNPFKGLSDLQLGDEKGTKGLVFGDWKGREVELSRYFLSNYGSMGRMVYLPTWMVGVFDGKSRYIYIVIYICHTHGSYGYDGPVACRTVLVCRFFSRWLRWGYQKSLAETWKKTWKSLFLACSFMCCTIFIVRVHHQKWSKHQMVAVSRLPGMSHRHCFFFGGSRKI